MANSVCLHCKVDIINIGRGKKKFCSDDCKNKYKTKEYTCLSCGNTFTNIRKTKFCCNRCSSIYNNNGGDTSSLEFFTKKYGDIIGKQKFLEKCYKVSKANMGRISAMKGKSHSIETKNKISKSVKDSDYHNNLRENGRTEDDKIRIKNYMAGVFSLEWFISKYGDNGKTLYEKRCNNIKETTYFNEYNKTNKNNYSNISQELFNFIVDNVYSNTDGLYYATLNHEYGCGTKHNFDFVDTNRKKVIEFNGDLFHANPKMFEENDTPNPYNTILSSKEIWEFDRIKNESAILKGYNVYIVWESDYKNNKEKCIQDCIKFLEE